MVVAPLRHPPAKAKTRRWRFASIVPELSRVRAAC
jgi:hypothetical protein